MERGQGLAVRAREAHARNARRREPDPGGDGRDRAGRHLARVHVRQAATSCEAVDLIAVHRYGGSQSSNAEQRSGGAQSWASQAGGKLVFVEEWGVDTGEDDATSKLPAQAADINKAGLPSLYWQVLPKASAGCSYIRPEERRRRQVRHLRRGRHRYCRRYEGRV